MSIYVSELTKKFGENLVLNKFSAAFSANEVTCIMGPSGLGKTTLLSILMGLLSYEEGAVTGVPINKSAVFQEDRLCEDFKALSNIRVVCDQKISDEWIIANLHKIGLNDNLEKPVREFSGGMKRRVAIVRAMLAESQIIFLDEPFKGLDEGTKKETIEYIKSNRNGRTVIMVTHNIEEAEAFDAKVVYVG